MTFPDLALEASSEVYPNLWVGSKDSLRHDLVNLGYKYLVLCAQEIQPPAASFPGVTIFRCPFMDDDSVPVDPETARMVKEASQFVSRSVQSNRPILVTCHAGINRSALVAALALMNLGFSASDAVSQIRAGRSDHCLSNKSFLEFLGVAEKI